MRPTTTFRSKKEFVYETIRERILSGELEPETRLIIDELSSDLGVSPIPVREALQQLQSEGLVTIEPYVGARVAEMHKESIEEIFALLEATEVISGRAACSRLTDDDLAQIESLLHAMDATVNDVERWSEQNVELHQLFCEKANMPLVGALMQQVVDYWNRLRRLYLEQVFSRRIRDAQRDHWILLEALRTRDPDKVEKVVQEHNRQALAGYLRHLE
ncbi:MAG: GntR family transcriptional regulator [Chloroflexota bacterium]